MTEPLPPMGLIAAGGGLPLAAARGIKRAGREVACVGLAGHYDPTLPSLCDRFRPAGYIQLGKWIRTLKRWGCEELVMVGKVEKIRMYDPMRWFRYTPDLRAAKVWFITLSQDRRPNRMLGAIADECARDGLTMIDSTKYIPELMADEGVMTRAQPSAHQSADIQFAVPIAHRMGDLDIGQSVAAKDRDIVAVEAIEGTDAMIERAGSLCKRGGWTLIKLAKPRQDMRFDVPTVGPTTIEKLSACGGACLAIEAGKTIILDKPDTLALADRLGIAVVGVKVADA